MELPQLGQHCKMEFCNKLDFLPIRCDGCNDIYCSEHYSYYNHQCKHAKVRDNQVPICPLCSKPVPAEKGQEDYEVSRHIDQYCKTETKIYTNQCTFGKCKKRELVPFKCSCCDKNFCLKHRHADVHECKGKTKRPTQSQRDILAQAALRRQNNQGNHARNVQGTMSEDEALARAIEASMRESYQPQISVGGSSNNDGHDKNKCAIS